MSYDDSQDESNTVIGKYRFLWQTEIDADPMHRQQNRPNPLSPAQNPGDYSPQRRGHGMVFGNARRSTGFRGSYCRDMSPRPTPPTMPTMPSVQMKTTTMPSTPKSPSKLQQNKKGKDLNKFHQAITCFARDEGFEPKRIVPLFKTFSSADFLCGPPSMALDWSHKVPLRVWQRVCEHFNARAQRPYQPVELAEHPTIFKEKAMVFIASRFTEQCIEDRLIAEHFPTARRLYQFLKWTMRISKVAQAMAKFEGQSGGKIMVIDTELHDQRGQSLYALCTPNDAMAPKSQKWQFAALRTSFQITKLLDIDQRAMPRGVRKSCTQFEGHRALQLAPYGLQRLKAHIAAVDAQRKLVRYCHLKCIQTGSGRKGKRNEPTERVLELAISTFYSKVRRALECPHTPLVPMVSIVSKKHGKRKAEDFSVDYLLPVRIGPNWVGVVFRGTEPVMALMDIYDISNKALLCDPSFNVEGMRWFQNWYNRLRIVPDSPFEGELLRSEPIAPEIIEDFPLCTETPPLPPPLSPPVLGGHGAPTQVHCGRSPLRQTVQCPLGGSAAFIGTAAHSKATETVQCPGYL